MLSPRELPRSPGLVPLTLGQYRPSGEQATFRLIQTVQRKVRAERLLISCPVGRVDLTLNVHRQDLFSMPGEVFGYNAFGTRLAIPPWEIGTQVVLTVRWTAPPVSRVVYVEPTKWNRRKYRRAWYVTFTPLPEPWFSALVLCRLAE